MPSSTLLPTGLIPLLIVLLSRQACSRFPGPLFVEPYMENITAVKGTDVLFTCRVANLGRNMVAFLRADDPPRLIAYDEKVFRQRHKYEVHPRVNNDHWVLKIKNVHERDIGGYMCQVNTEPMIVQVGYLTLQVPPQVDRNTASAVEVREGHNVTLACNAFGNPTPTVIWRRQDRGNMKIDGATGYGVSVSNGSELTLTKVSRLQMTEYVCVASNGILPDESWTVKLHITFPPTVTPQAVQVSAANVPPTVTPQAVQVSAANGGFAILACNADAWPRPQFHWEKDGRTLPHIRSKYESHEEVGDSYGSVAKLKVSQLGYEDFGTYACVATNEQGSHSAVIDLVESIASDNRLPAVVLAEGSGDDNDLLAEPSEGEDDEDDEDSERRVIVDARTMRPPQISNEIAADEGVGHPVVDDSITRTNVLPSKDESSAAVSQRLLMNRAIIPLLLPALTLLYALSSSSSLQLNMRP
uniref:Ig-like domain-containing protein n=1 Tax=Plectus sambesii TaxID=2011161 RepID=A0A914V4X2_9BILA